MDYFNKIRSTVTQVAAQVSNALPGNPLTREYDVGEQIGSAGPGLYWKIYAGKKKSTKQPVSVWLFERKEIERWTREEKEEFIELIKKGVAQLTRLRHPRLLVVEHAIEESRDSLAFCTEPVFASLANCLGRCDNVSGTQPPHLAGFRLLEIEIKQGLFQLAEALAFLHVDARILHGNLCPESVVVNCRGQWKLAGFDFACQGVLNAPGAGSGQTSWAPVEWQERKMGVMQPSLDYLAPERVLGGRVDGMCDVFSLGLLSYAVFNACRPMLEQKGSLDRYRRNTDTLKSLPAAFTEKIPAVFKDDFKQCLQYTPELRPDATQFTKIAFFEDPLLKCLSYFESLMQMDNNQKMHFFKGLPIVLEKFDKRPLIQQVLPALAGEFTTPDLVPFILPSVFLISERATQREFTQSILPHLVPVFTMQRPYQIVLILLQKMDLLLTKATDEDVRQHVLPLIYNAIGSETTRIQELCLSIVPSIGKLVDRASMKTQLLPKLLKLATDGGVLAVRVQALVCLGKLLPTLEAWMITEQVLPTLPKITSKEPGVLMAILGIYKLSFESSQVSIGREQLAKSAIPFLTASSVENTLNLGQFEQFMTLIKAMLATMEKEQRARLQQLSAGQEEQRSVNFEQVLSTGGAQPAPLPDSLKDLGDLCAPAPAGVAGGGAATPSKGGALSLEEKKRLAAAQTGGKATPPLATPTGKMSMNQMAAQSGTNTTISGMGIGGMNMGGGGGSKASLGGLDSLFDPLPPTRADSAKGPVDISDFLAPSTFSQNTTVPISNPTFPSQPTFTPSQPFPTLSGPPAASNPLAGFMPPPRSTNQAVRGGAGGGGMNGLDSLLSFPPSPGQYGQMGSLGPIGAARPVQKPPAKDPFADLLG